MIYHCKISIEELQKLQKKFDWQNVRPNSCPKCKGKIWGHGYVLRYFQSILKGVFLKRWRCTYCYLILICRPTDYWRRFQNSVSHIYKSLIYRIKYLRWPPWVQRQRGGHWLKKIITYSTTHLLMKETILETITFFRDKNLVIF